MQQEAKKKGIIIPKNKLSEDALQALVEEFILREGTNYGTREFSLHEKKQQILSQLNKESILILFDPELESTTLLPKDDLTKLDLQNFEILS